MTAATQPSLEDILLGGIPWIPKVNFHNPCLSYENGEAFLKPFHRAVAGELATVAYDGRTAATPTLPIGATPGKPRREIESSM